MADIWLDVVTPKDALLASCLLPSLHKKQINTLVTAKKQTQTNHLLKLLNVPHVEVGKYGYTLKEKLLREQERILKFVELFEKSELPKVLWTHGGVSAIRTAFGLQIPIVYSNDTVHATHVAKLVASLVDWLIAPKAFGKSWSKFGIPKSRIKLYDGVEEVAWIKAVTPAVPREIEELSQENQLILFRNVEYKASYYHDVKLDTLKLIDKLSKVAKIVYLPRYEEEKKVLKKIKNIWFPRHSVIAYKLMPTIDLVVGSGGTICRESALLGIPTISFHFWDVIAEYLNGKGFPLYHITNYRKIIEIAKDILKDPEKHKIKTSNILRELNSPVDLTVHYLEMLFECTPNEQLK